jgi:o-succinylbenzoate---CoA ligase
LSAVLVDAWLPRAAARHPDRPAVNALTYAQLEREATAAARRLAARGVREGDRVGLGLPAGEAFCIALHACLLLGAAAVPFDVRLGAEERVAIARDAAAVVDGPLEGEQAEVAPSGQHDLDAVAIVVHTSGSGGAPKPIGLTYGNWLWSALGSAVALGLDADERWLCALPLSHVGGLSIVMRSAIAATTAIVHERFDT